MCLRTSGYLTQRKANEGPARSRDKRGHRNDGIVADGHGDNSCTSTNPRFLLS